MIRLFLNNRWSLLAWRWISMCAQWMWQIANYAHDMLWISNNSGIELPPTHKLNMIFFCFCSCEQKPLNEKRYKTCLCFDKQSWIFQLVKWESIFPLVEKLCRSKKFTLNYKMHEVTWFLNNRTFYLFRNGWKSIIIWNLFLTLWTIIYNCLIIKKKR